MKAAVRAVAAELPASIEAAKVTLSWVLVLLVALLAPYAGYAIRIWFA